MDHPASSRALFSETVRSLYRIYGYEELMKEVLFIHHHSHLSSSPAFSLPASAPPASSPPASSPSVPPASSLPVSCPNEPLPAHKVTSTTLVGQTKRPVLAGKGESTSTVTVNKVDDPHNEVVEQDAEQDEKRETVVRMKYARSEKPDAIRCTGITAKGVRCSVSRLGSSPFCSRHAKEIRGGKQEGKEVEEVEEEQEEQEEQEE